MAWISESFGEARLISRNGLPPEGDGFSTLDLSAAAWAMHNGDVTGHGSAVMPAADWTFLPLSPRHPSETDLLAVARPEAGMTRSENQLAQLQALAHLIGQASDRIALEEEQQRLARLEDRDAFRRTLLASIAHDFRTPLTVVIGELSKSGPSDMGASNALAAAKRLDRMMDDLIGAARMEAGALSPRCEAVDLVDVVSDAISSWDDTSATIELIQDVAADVPMVEADPILLRHVLVNLIDNAARHAQSAIRIIAREEGPSLCLSVEDDGFGIADDQRMAIFDRFARIEGDDRRGGSGLGLAIVKGFSEAMGMAVSVESSEMGGACFRLTMATRAVRGQ